MTWSWRAFMRDLWRAPWGRKRLVITERRAYRRLIAGTIRATLLDD